MGKVRVKTSSANGGAPITISPEYDDCRRIAAEHKVPLRIRDGRSPKAGITFLKRKNGFGTAAYQRDFFTASKANPRTRAVHACSCGSPDATCAANGATPSTRFTKANECR